MLYARPLNKNAKAPKGNSFSENSSTPARVRSAHTDSLCLALSFRRPRTKGNVLVEGALIERSHCIVEGLKYRLY